jgi:hypothetical protein
VRATHSLGFVPHFGFSQAGRLSTPATTIQIGFVPHQLFGEPFFSTRSSKELMIVLSAVSKYFNGSCPRTVTLRDARIAGDVRRGDVRREDVRR